MSTQDEAVEILVVEDSPTQAARLGFILQKHGYRMTATRNGREALASMSLRVPALVLSDVVMPEMDGYALCRSIKHGAAPNTPVVLLTSLSDPADVVKGLEAGADSFIFKPYEERYLLARIEYLLANRHLRADDSTRTGVEILFAGRKFFITSDRLQILNLLLSTYEAAVQRNQELSRVQDELTRVNETLESTVRERTSELAEEIEERKRVELKLQGKLVRLQLLRRITRAIGDRLDLRHVFQVVCDSIEEQLPLDFCAIALCDAAAGSVMVCSVGPGSRARAARLGLAEAAPLTIADEELARCMRGALVHEPDLTALPFALARRLADEGLHSAVLAPLRTEEAVCGIVIAAREQANSFSSADCEFLDQLSEHVALAANQAQLHGALRIAYDDLHRTQRAVLQQERLRALGEMASGIAHDINNAISPVALYTESLLEKETTLSARGREQLQTVQLAIEDVAETVARMREFYRPRDEQVRLMQVAVNPLVQQVVELTRARWRDMAQQRGVAIDVVTELQDGLAPINAAEAEIREVLTNLVFNAVDAMPRGGTMTLRTRAVDDAEGNAWVEIEVADSGIGMDDETRRRCLEPFFTTKGDRGTGLGLAMVYGTVQRHGAQLQIDSVPGAGTVMRLRFLATGENELPDTGWGVLPPEVRRTLRVLLVDDDAVLARSMTDILESEGHHVTATVGGQEGIAEFSAALARGEPYEVVITDLGMPKVDGRQVAQAVKAASPRTPVLMLTGWGRRMSEEGERPPHVDQLLSKPPRLAELRAALGRVGPPGMGSNKSEASR
jgi:DNA-binding response OmpR family regulator/signal transduction histidine kinase